MKLLAHVVDAVGRRTIGIDHMFLELSADFANVLLDHQAQLKTLQDRFPRVMWLTLEDDKPAYFRLGTSVDRPQHSWFRYQAPLRRHRVVELPEHFSPRDDADVAGAYVSDVVSHLCIARHAVAWCLLVAGCPAGSTEIPNALLYRAAGVKIPDVCESI